MRLNRNAIWMVPLAFILTFPLWSIPVGKFLTPRISEDADSGSESSSDHNFNMDSVKILQSQDGRKTAYIRAETARTGKTSDELIMNKVDADIYDEKGRITNVVAKTGHYSIKTNILTLRDDVVVNKKADGQFLYTDLLIYDNENRFVYCPEKTLLEGKDVKIDGGSLTYDIRAGRYTIEKGVECTIGGFIEP